MDDFLLTIAEITYTNNIRLYDIHLHVYTEYVLKVTQITYTNNIWLYDIYLHVYTEYVLKVGKSDRNYISEQYLAI